jgi:hypothetical protein
MIAAKKNDGPGRHARVSHFDAIVGSRSTGVALWGYAAVAVVFYAVTRGQVAACVLLSWPVLWLAHRASRRDRAAALKRFDREREGRAANPNRE